MRRSPTSAVQARTRCRTWAAAVACVVPLLACGGGASTPPGSGDGIDSGMPPVVPAQSFDLSHWKLTLPVDAAGGVTGEPQEIPPEALGAGYSSTWFHVGDDGDLVFWAPVSGATTENSSYPRSELRELVDPNDDNVNWDLRGNAVLDATCAVTKVPTATGKVVIGQIHAFQAEPLVKLRYYYQSETRSGRLDALVRLQPDSDAITSYPLLSGLALGAVFDYRISVADGVLRVAAGGKAPADIVLDPAWSAERFYFKAGSYAQANGSSTTDGGEVRFHRLSVEHPP